MKMMLIAAFAVAGGLSFAGQSPFVQAYDAGNFDEAARQIDGLDTSDPGVARRLGVMYYNARGIEGNRARGRALLEQAMMAGDAAAAVNLAKIHLRIEKDLPKAAWCLLVAEGLKDVSVKDDVAQLRAYLGEGYPKGIGTYVAQLRDSLASAQTALKDKTDASERERAALTSRITACQDAAREKGEDFAREREKLATANADLAQRLAAAEEKITADREEIDGLDAKLARATSDLSDLDRLTEEHEAATKRNAAQGEEIEKLKRELAEATTEGKKAAEMLEKSNVRHQAALEKYNALVASSNQKVSNYETALAEAKAAAEESDRKHKEMQTRYNKLVEKYNELVREYNRLFKVYKEGASTALNTELDVTAVDGVDKANARWFGRGWNTFFCAPCNFVRTIPAVGALYDSTLKSTNGGYAFFIAVIGSPFVFCCEVVPTACDLGNGLVDMISLGTYGNWLYSGSIESRWNKRDNSHFPWLDRASWQDRE